MSAPVKKNIFACFVLLIFLSILPRSMRATEPLVIRLWPHGAPGERAITEPERDMTTVKDGYVAGKPLIRLGNVSEPSIAVYRPSDEKNTGTAVLVFPGGGYRILALDLEGTEICQWLTTIGVTAVLVKYRVPQPANGARYAHPLEDAQRAMSIVRLHARDWGIKPDHVGVLGFSAGGHLAAVLSSSSDTHVSPNFAVLIYPAYLSVRDEGEQVSPEVTPTNHTAPTFIVQTEDDHAFIEGTLLYYRTLKRAAVPAEMHVFSSGGHGYGLRPSGERVTGWPALAEAWLHSRVRTPMTSR